ncbi:MAG TPA: PaaX family transcriptional regulator C-terminal domain-containing protein [Pedococcus sp.]|nr:PaaX family transcriptional regulator C-terminal domain-containing protein [Pedococcus sp.]
MHARSALFDLYGDHLLDRDGWAPISACVGLLGSLGISAPAVRTAVSRMAREGWLEPVERDLRGYAVSARGRERLREAHARIYRTEHTPWDGRWHLVVVDRAPDRNARARGTQALAYLGYGQLAADTWIAPRPSRELGAALDPTGMAWRSFTGTLDGDARQVVSGVWDLSSLADAYRVFTDTISPAEPASTPEEAFVARTQLVHEWRLFLFSDPGLPDEVLPDQWAGREAARSFDARALELLPGARLWVDAWLTGRGDRP